MKIFFLLLGILPFSCLAQETPANTFIKTPVVFTTDTVHNGKKIFLTTNILFTKDTLSIKATYIYTDTNFSFYDIQLFDTLEVFLDGVRVKLSQAKYTPFIREYMYGYNFVNVLNRNGRKNILLFGQEKFCNGTNCSDIGVLNISVCPGKAPVCMEVESGFCDDELLMNVINKQYMKSQKVEIPVTDDCQHGGKVKKWVAL